MNLGIKSITLRFDDNQLGYLQPVQGDTKSRGFLVEMVSTDGEVLDASSNYECRLYGVNSNYPDKTFYTVATVEEGRYKLYLSTDMVSKAGTLKLQVALYKGSQELIQSEVKEVEVTESMANGGNIGKDLVVDFTKLEKALERVDIQEKAYKDSLQNQAVIKSDIDRKQRQVSNDTTAVRKIRKDMEGVMAAEAGRVSAEKDRQSKEKTRQSQEDTRVKQEKGRASAERDRQNFELERAKAETARVKAENARASAEKDRQSQENTRESNEDKRKSNETSRQNAESTRIQQYDKAKQLLEILGENPTADLGSKVGEIDDKISNFGGKNYIKNSKNITGWTKQDGGNHLITDEFMEEFGIQGQRIKSDAGDQTDFVKTYVNLDTDELVVGKIYTFSVYVKNNRDVDAQLRVNGFDWSFAYTLEANQCKRFIVTGKRENMDVYWKNRIQFQVRSANKAYFVDMTVARPQLELGHIATDWTPAPEDFDTKIDGEVSKLQTALNSKASSSHSHSISDVSGLQNALNSKASSSHSHTGMIKTVGNIKADNITVIPSGGSTSGIPKETLIFELE